LGLTKNSQTFSVDGAGRIPASSVAGGEGPVGEQLEEVESYLVVGPTRVRDGRTRPAHGEQV